MILQKKTSSLNVYVFDAENSSSNPIHNKNALPVNLMQCWVDKRLGKPEVTQYLFLLWRQLFTFAQRLPITTLMLQKHPVGQVHP